MNNTNSVVTDIKYDENYYRTNNYVDYLARQDRYNQLAQEIMEHLRVHNLDQDPILDFGCATGMLMKGVEKLGYEQIYGTDISLWALSRCLDDNLDVSQKPDYTMTYGLTFALDVLEHMTVDDVQDFLYNLTTRALVFRMPICREGEDDYVLECSRTDPTHVIRWTKNQWERVFRANNYLCLDLNLHTIYNSEGVYTGIALNRDIF